MSYDASLQDLQSNIEELLSNLLFDSASVVKRAVLHNISSLCIFLGRQKTNDLLLSHMITYLNDRDWLLRYAFFESIVDVAACAGGRSLEEYILPLMIQALSGWFYVDTNSLANTISRRRRNCRSQGSHRSHKPL
jgi:phosphoinositide-3-kinase, regulatory subunit 4